jgi:catechol 2,3-dioxygenase-like lactoylglutathione lyase family enzyme
VGEREPVHRLAGSVGHAWPDAAHHVRRQREVEFVPDLQAAVERLKSAGARLLNEPRKGAGGHLYTFVHPRSTGGVLLELIQE